MAFSWQESVKPAGTQDIQCDIEYLDKSYIHVYLDGAETTAFTWTSSTNIRLNSPLSAETAVLLIRKTEREYLYIEFASGAPFIEGNVDTQNTQLLHLAQELVEGRYIEGFYGDINMHRYRITNLGDPVDARDAANKQYVDAGDARLDVRIDAEAADRKAADDALDARTINLEQTYFNANTNSFPWWTITTTSTNTITPGMSFSKAKVRLNGVTQTAGYSYTVNNGVVTFAETVPAGTLVDMTIGIDTDADTSAVSNILALLSSHTAGEGAALIGLQDQGTVASAIQYVTPEMFRAVGDGIADDTTKLQQAADYAQSKGRTLCLSGGKVYKLSSSLQLRCNLLGDGTCTILQSADSQSCIDILADYVTVSRIRVSPASVVSSALQFAGIVIKGCNNCKVDECVVQYKGRTDREGSGIGVYNGNNNVIRNCYATGASLSPGTRHDYGGNDFFVYGDSSRNKFLHNVGIGANIRGILQQTTVLGQQCNYNEFDGNVSIGHIGYGHLCYELNHSSTTSMKGTVFRNGFVANIAGSATDPTSGIKYFGAGVYNQEGQDTTVEGYRIYNVCQDPDIQLTLPMAGISSTRGDLRIKDCMIAGSGRSGIKISSSGFADDTRTAFIDSCSISNTSDEAVYLVGTNRSQISGLVVTNCGRIVRATGNSAYSRSHLTVSGVTAYNSTGILLDGFDTAIVNDVHSENCVGTLQAQNIRYLLASDVVANGGTGTGISVAASVLGGFLRDSVVVDGATGFNLAAKIVYERLVGTGNTTNFTGAYSGLVTLGAGASVDVANISFAQVGAGSDITTITGGVTNQQLYIRATAARTIVHNSASIILKSGANVALVANSTLRLWCIDGTRWLEV